MIILKYMSHEDNIWPRLTQQELASLVGATSGVVNRSLKTLKEKGVIKLERQCIKIVNKEALQEVARQ